MSLVWVITFLGLLLAEFLTVGLISVWFAVGALAALIASFITESVLIQIVVFVGVSIIALIATQPLIKKFKINKFEPTNSDRVIGKTGEVVQEITSNKYGRVIVFGTEWLAASDQTLVVGTKVVILKIEGNKLIVEKEGDK